MDSLQEFHSRLAYAQQEADKIKTKANLWLEVAIERKMEATNALRDANEEANVTVQQAIHDADYIRNVARQDANIIINDARNEYERMIHIFKARLDALFIASTIDAQQD
jgi:cell division septum initiation protein DivIVA